MWATIAFLAFLWYVAIPLCVFVCRIICAVVLGVCAAIFHLAVLAFKLYMGLVAICFAVGVIKVLLEALWAVGVIRPIVAVFAVWGAVRLLGASAAPKSTTRRAHAWSCQTKVLYHQTDAAAADAIVRSGKMKRGTGGMAGGGIYFATCLQDTDRKAQRKGAYLECRVELGRVKHITANGDSSITYRSLKSEGFDSVLIPRQNGHEYVVYSWGQVKDVRRLYQ